MKKELFIIILLVIFALCYCVSIDGDDDFHDFQEEILDKGAVVFSIMIPKNYQINNQFNHSEFCYIGDCFVSESFDGYLNLSYYEYYEHIEINLEDSLYYRVFCKNHEDCKLIQYKTLDIDGDKTLFTFYSFRLNNKKYYGCTSERVLNQNSLLTFRHTTTMKDNFMKRSIKILKSISVISNNKNLPFKGKSL